MKTSTELLDEIYRTPESFKNKKIRDALLARDAALDKQNIGETFLNYFIEKNSDKKGSLLSLSPASSLRINKTLVAPAQASQPLNQPSIMGAAAPLAVSMRAGASFACPEVFSISGEGQFNILFYCSLPVVTKHFGGTHHAVVELSDPACVALNARGGASIFDRNILELNKVFIMHDTFGGNNHAHWILDWLPRFKVFETSEQDIRKINLINPLPLNKTQLFCLHRLGIESSQVVRMRRPSVDSPINFRASAVLGCSTSGPDLRHPLQHGSPWAVNFVRSLFKTVKGNLIEKKFVLNRRNTRRLHFSESANKRLRKNGYKEIYAEDIGFEDQISLFRNADCIISSHGAGLANLIFCEPGKRVLEIFPENYGTSAFFVTSLAIGLDYSCAVGISINAEQVSHPRDADIMVNDSVLDKFLSS
jgi:capsular polysaccharide biosynthesis protein